MKNNYKLILGLYLFLAVVSCSQPSDIIYRIENTHIRKDFLETEGQRNTIGVRIYDKTMGKEINIASEVPYFEFVVNNQVLKASDHIWEFEGAETREMGNDGTEHILGFICKSKVCSGLRLYIYQQIFTAGSIVREKIVLKGTDKDSFALNRKNGKLHFSFPGYAISKSINESVHSTEIRIASWNDQPISFARPDDPPGKSNHMYYPVVNLNKLDENDSTLVKGPFRIIHLPQLSFGLGYEHASQDNTNGLLNDELVSTDGRIVDAMQGTKGIFNFKLTNEDFKFLGIRAYNTQTAVLASVDALRGAYLDGEAITKKGYESVWVAHFCHQGNQPEDSKAMIRDYLLNKTCEYPASRKPEFYYNTWGMQRASKELRDVLNYENIFKEIEYSSQLGVDIFVLDDGWQEKFGIWKPNPERLPDGLAPIRQKLDEHNMKLGIWLSPATVDSTSQRYREHPEWVIKDSEGNPIKAQWGHCAFDMVSDYTDLFVEDCKWLIDQGARFFKWDAINTFFSTLPNLHHGSDEYSGQEIRARYEYLLPLYVTKAMQALVEYEPELIIEVDLTEARRVMVGLAPLSYGKLFWMNNGASGYNDYGGYRTQSMRTIPNQYGGIMPLELFTYANYPHNLEGFQKYNVYTSLISGHGFWGKLDLMPEQDRKEVGKMVAMSKKVLPYLTEVNPKIIGKVGDSPEIYSQINYNEGAGQVIAFSTKAIGDFVYEPGRISDKILGVLNTPYEISDETLSCRFQFNKPFSAGSAFILPAINDIPVRIIKSSAIITGIVFEENMICYESGRGTQIIRIGKSAGIPAVEDNSLVKSRVREEDDLFILEISVEKKATVNIKIVKQ